MLPKLRCLVRGTKGGGEMFPGKKSFCGDDAIVHHDKKCYFFLQPNRGVPEILTCWHGSLQPGYQKTHQTFPSHILLQSCIHSVQLWQTAAKKKTLEISAFVATLLNFKYVRSWSSCCLSSQIRSSEYWLSESSQQCQFDCLYLNGHSLRGIKWYISRRQAL